MILRLRVCIPTYNNSKTIRDVVVQALEKTSFQILVVDDGSDIPVSDLLPQNSRVAIHRFSKNQGKGSAIQFAIQDSVRLGFTHLLTMDGDGQHLATELNRLAAAAKENPWDLIIGNRLLSSADVPSISKFGRKFSNFWVKLQTGCSVKDSQSGYRLYPLIHCQNIRFWTKKFDFEIEILVRLLWKNVNIHEIDIGVFYPPASERVSHFHKFRDNLRISILNTFFVILTPFERFFQNKSAAPHWTGQTRGGKFGTAFLKFITKVLGLRSAYFCLFFVSPYFYFFSTTGRRASNEYFKNIFPEWTWLRRQFAVTKHFFCFGQILLDRIFSSFSNKITFNVQSVGAENIFEGVQQKNGLILLGAHVGAWDLAAKGLRRHGNLDMIVVEYRASGFTLKKARGDNAETPFQSLAVNEASMPILGIHDFLKAGKIIGLMGDRPMTNHFELIPFFGKLAAFDTTAFQIAASCQSPLSVSMGFRTGYKSYEYFAKPLRAYEYDKNQSKETQRLEWLNEYVQELETRIRKHPYQWFNFYPFWSSAPASPIRAKSNSKRNYLLEELHTQSMQRFDWGSAR